MKIRNEQGIEITIPKNQEAKVRSLLKKGESIDHIVNPIMKYGGKLPKADGGLQLGNNPNGMNWDNHLGQPNGYQGLQGYSPQQSMGDNQYYDPNQNYNQFNQNYNMDPNQSLGLPMDNTNLAGNNLGQINLNPTYNNMDWSQNQQTPTNYSQQGNNSTQGNQGNTFTPGNIFGQSTNKYFNRAATFGNAALASINGFKGVLDNYGNSRRNQRTAQQESLLQARGLRYNNINNMPQNQRYDQNNPLLMEFGGNISVNNYKAGNGGNIEAEGKEMVATPSGLAGELQGAPHSQGGIDLSLPSGSIILSEKLKDPITKKSYAKLAKPFSTEKDVNNLDSVYTSKVGKQTSELNIKLKNQKLQELFQLQENNKILGIHNDKIKQETMDEMESQHNPMEELQERGMAHGGKIYAGNGDFVPQTFQTKEGRYTPSGQDLNQNPLLDWENRRKDWESLALKEGALKKGERFKEIKDLQEFAYDWALDNNPELIKDMYKTYGATNKNERESTGYKGYDYNNLTLDQLKNLRGGFIDNLAGKRLFKPSISTPKTTSTTQGTPPVNPPVTQGSDAAAPVDKFNRPNTLQPNNYNVSLGNFNIPSNLSKDPVALGQLNPTYIDPRYLDIQPQLNDIQRGKSTFQRNLGSRTSTDVANLLQSQSNAYDQTQQTYGQKYNYDSNQDSQAQQYNARAKDNMAMYNLGEVNKFNDYRMRRDGIYDTQLRTNEQANIQNNMLQNNYDTRNSFIADHFGYPQGNQEYSLGTGNNAGSQSQDWDSKTVDKEGNVSYVYKKKKAYGGKITLPKKKLK